MADIRTGYSAGAAGASGPIAGVEVVGTRRRISWGAIFAGVVVVLAVQLLLSMLGLGIGLSVLNPGAGNSPNAGSLGLGAGIWWGVSYLIALFAGGYVAGRLAGALLSWDGALHGVLAWAFTLLVTFYLLGTAIGSVIGGAFSVVGNTVSTATQGLKSVVPEAAQSGGVTPDRIKQTANDLLNGQSSSNVDPKSMSHDQAVQEITTSLPKLALGGDQARTAHERIVQIMSAQLNISPDEANQRLDQLAANLQQKTQQTTDTARQAADKAAAGGSRASFIAFIGLVLGAIAAALGGQVGARSRGKEVVPA
jgi:hypothetical protein